MKVETSKTMHQIKRFKNKNKNSQKCIHGIAVGTCKRDVELTTTNTAERKMNNLYIKKGKTLKLCHETGGRKNEE